MAQGSQYLGQQIQLKQYLSRKLLFRKAEHKASSVEAASTTGTSTKYDGIIAHIIASDRPSVSKSGLSEATRLRNFLLFTLVQDYKCRTAYPMITLSTEDMEHFTALASIMKLLARADATSSASAEEYRGTDVYLTQCVYEPCAVLGLQLHSVAVAITRWLRFTDLHGRTTHEDQTRGLFRDNPEQLTRKLFADRTVVIPAVVTSTQLLQDLLRGVKAVSSLYFDGVQRMEISSLPSERGYMTNVQYVLSAYGRQKREYNELVKSSCSQELSPQHWVSRFKLFIKERVHASSKT
ncbi:hypothetical protein LTR86_009329 [Recurvomyces mirabilis]|nr:hypothetical protein LTR86_009329 [Recurvomyces mirabilis]